MPIIEEKIGHYEMSVLPRSMLAADGSLLIPNDKYKLINAIEEMNNENSSKSRQPVQSFLYKNC